MFGGRYVWVIGGGMAGLRDARRSTAWFGWDWGPVGLSGPVRNFVFVATNFYKSGAMERSIWRNPQDGGHVVEVIGKRNILL